MSLAQLVRPVDMVRQQARQAHLGLTYQATIGDDDPVTWRLRVEAAPCADPWVVLTGDERPLAVAVSTHKGGVLIGERDWTDFHDDGRLMAWTLQHDALVDRIAALVGRHLGPDCLAKNPAQRDPTLEAPFIKFEIESADGLLVSRGTLAVDEHDFEHVIANAKRLNTKKPPIDWCGVPLPLVVRTATQTMDVQTLRACRAGDIIVLGHRDQLHQHLQACHANGQPLPLRCTLEGNGVKISLASAVPRPPTPSSEEFPAMTNADADGAHSSATELPDSGPLSAAQIPVKLCIQTGAVEVMLGDLEGLETGAILPLEAPVAGTNVTILVNGTALGDGELVAAGDKLGVCIKRWRPDGL